MHCAAFNGHSSVVEVLIKSHADINAVDKVSQWCELIPIGQWYTIVNYLPTPI